MHSHTALHSTPHLQRDNTTQQQQYDRDNCKATLQIRNKDIYIYTTHQEVNLFYCYMVAVVG